MKKNNFEMCDCVMNNQNGKVFVVASDEKQTRNRRQLRGMEIRHPSIVRTAESKLTKISSTALCVCAEAERIVRWKKKQSEADKQILTMARALRDSIIG